MTPLLQIESIYSRYNASSPDVLSGLSLTVDAGETVAIIGQSGSGKSTLLKAICGLAPLHGGNIALKDQWIARYGHWLYIGWEVRRHLVLVTQESTLLPHYTVGKNIIIGLQVVFGQSYERAIQAGRALTRELDLSDEDGLDAFLRKYPEQLSGGQRQRVQLARALLLKPDVLLLDEVTSSIDPETTEKVVQTLWRIKQTKPDQSIVIVSHLFDFVERFADRVVFLHNGIIHEEVDAAEFRSRLEKPESRAFVGCNPRTSIDHG